MDGHRTAELRSIAYHRAIAARLPTEPALRDRARARVEGWAASGAVAPRWVEPWRRLLALPLDELVERLPQDTQEMIDLRQVTPFAGAIPPRDRWAFLRALRDAG